VTVTYALGGADSGNYDVVQPASQTANITPAPLVVSGITAGNKTFDGTTSASINAANALLSGKVSGDDVTVTASGAFTDPAVGNGKLVNLFSRYGGADAGNYMITDQTSTLANILAVAAASPVASSSSVNLPPQVRHGHAGAIVGPAPAVGFPAAVADAFVDADGELRSA
jgi:hypothetical protein